MINYINEREIKHAITTLKKPGELFEIRIIEGKTIYSGYFKSADKAIEEIAKQRLNNKNVFITLNEIKPACYSRAQHDCIIKIFREPTTGDKEISRYSWLLIDLDPERPAGISSTNEELEAAKEKAARVYKWLSKKGFKQPLAGMSGNGCHLLYKIDLENTDENTAIVESVLKALDVLFSDAVIKIDTSVFNPARISKLYGTTAQKGSSTEERPHRMSVLTSVPDTIETTPIDKLKEVAAIYKELLPTTSTQSKRNYNDSKSNFDVYEFLNDHGISYTEATGKGYTKLILDECIFNPDHKAPDAAVIVWDNGTLGYNCFHDSCQHNHWREFRLKLDPNAYDIPTNDNYKKYSDYEEPATAEEPAAEEPPKDTRDDLTKFFDTIQTEAYKPHPTGIKFFDTLLDGGIVNQSLLLLLAAPAAGKTTLAQQISEEMARNKKKIIYINFEMSREQMLSKAISAKYYRNGGTKTALQILRGYEWSDDDRAALERIIDDYRRYNYPYIRYNPDGVTSEINGLLKYLTAIGDKALEAGEAAAPAIVIDYLHLITSNDHIDDAELIKQTVVGLKDYAKEYDTFVIGIVASNRASNKSGRLTMDSGRDSSNLEYTGDYILSLNYQEIDSGKIKPASTKDDINEKLEKLYSQDKKPMILRVLKNRFGRQGNSRKVLFNAPYNLFYDADDKAIPPAGFMLDDGAPAFDD